MSVQNHAFDTTKLWKKTSVAKENNMHIWNARPNTLLGKELDYKENSNNEFCSRLMEHST